MIARETKILLDGEDCFWKNYTPSGWFRDLKGANWDLKTLKPYYQSFFFTNLLILLLFETVIRELCSYIIISLA